MSSRLNQLADRFVDQQLQFDPLLAYASGLPTREHGRFADRTPQSLAAHDAAEREDLRALLALPVADVARRDRATYANLREQLEADLQLRVCRTELWNVNHFRGWQSKFTDAAEKQPVGSAEERTQALERWSGVPRYVAVEIANLRLGLVQGYSAPQAVVRRVIRQMDDLAAADPEASPFYSPAKRSDKAVLQSAFRRLVVEQIDPALRSYRDFLEAEYLPQAREGVAISDLPNGVACYQAFLRVNTTLSRSPQAVFDLGRKTVAENVAAISRIGGRNDHTTDLKAIVADPEQACRALSIEGRPARVLAPVSRASQRDHGGAPYRRHAAAAGRYPALAGF